MTEHSAEYEQVRQVVQPVMQRSQGYMIDRLKDLSTADLAWHSIERAAMLAVVAARQDEHHRWDIVGPPDCPRCAELAALGAELEAEAEGMTTEIGDAPYAEAKCGCRHRDHGGERCGCCGLPSHVGFSVPDEVWAAAGAYDGTLCIMCFVSRAEARSVEWCQWINWWPVCHICVAALADVREPAGEG